VSLISPTALAPLATLVVRASRFFARPRAFDIECPLCGTVFLVGLHRKHRKYWDPKTSKFTCMYCERTWIVGIALWSMKRGIAAPVTKPGDQIPHERQLAQLRALLPSFWLMSPLGRRPRTSNLVIEQIDPPS